MIKIIILIAAYAIAATASAQTPLPQNSVLNAAGGRYVFGQISELRRDPYLLDTLTGYALSGESGYVHEHDFLSGKKKSPLTEMVGRHGVGVETGAGDCFAIRYGDVEGSVPWRKGSWQWRSSLPF